MRASELLNDQASAFELQALATRERIPDEGDVSPNTWCLFVEAQTFLAVAASLRAVALALDAEERLAA